MNESIDQVATSASELATTEEQADSIAQVLDLSNRIVEANSKLREETRNITGISEQLSKYSDSINSDLSQYQV